MFKKYLIVGGIAAAIIGTIAISRGTLAYRGNLSQIGPNYNQKRHQEMQKAFENKDYNKWKEIMGNRGRAAEVINESNFSRFVEMRKLMLEGKTDEANKIRLELGLGKGKGIRHNNEMNRGQNRNGNFIDKNNDGICDRLQ